MIDSVKETLDYACEAASNLLKSADPDNKDHTIEIQELFLEDSVALYMKYNTEVVFQRIWKTTDKEIREEDIRTVLYGGLLTEMVATFAVVSKKAIEHLIKGS